MGIPPREKAKHSEFGKKSRLSQMSKRELAHILPWRRDFTERKPHYVLEKKPSGHLKEHRAARWMERMKRIFSFLLREHATVFYRVIFLFWHKKDLHGWRADGRACSHNQKSVHGNE